MLPRPRCQPELYAKLFDSVNFGTKANRFLGACGSKNKVSIEDVAEALADNPERFFQLAGVGVPEPGHIQRYPAQNEPQPCSAWLRRTKTEGKAEWDYGHQFLTYQGVTIVDDMNDYQLLVTVSSLLPKRRHSNVRIDISFGSPSSQSTLAGFYASLGCNYVSAAVKEQCNGLREIPATETCSDVQSLILKRLPLFIQNYTDARLRVTIPSSSDHLKVKGMQPNPRFQNSCGRKREANTIRTGDREE
ncbi:hypothetical protein EDD16DRAFT_1707163 [Pisolithus croceorrhizus]|nr:hypothetical protein EDD16DRAFT_1707163 [Pisolithus croceorrhizus]